MKKRILLTCLALTGVLGLSSTAYASEVSVQSLIDGSPRQKQRPGRQKPKQLPLRIQTLRNPKKQSQTDRSFPEQICMMQALFPLTQKFTVLPQQKFITGIPLPLDPLQEQNTKSPV